MTKLPKFLVQPSLLRRRWYNIVMIILNSCNNVPAFDKPASDEIEGASEEDEAIALMVLTAYLTPKQEGEEIIEVLRKTIEMVMC